VEPAKPQVDFSLVRDRDAWATIRGYVYQVDLTIDRWLSLRPGDVLEVERGEDIDTLYAIEGAPADTDRLLEQIKHRDASLTLRNPAVIAFLAGAVEHRAANPDLRLKHRLVSNAAVGRELPSLMPGSVPAISAWSSISGESLSPPQRVPLLQGIRDILTKAKRPSDLADETWTRFERFVASATDDDLLAFVRSVEWAVNAPESGAVRASVLRVLVAEGHASTPEEARAAYERLFFAVFDLLSRAGVKRLTRESLRSEVATAQQSQAQTRREFVALLLAEIDRRIDALERRVQTHDESLALQRQVLAQVQADLGRRQGIEATIAYHLAQVTFDPPPRPTPFCARPRIVETVRARHKSAVWIALQGAIGSGKTQLAREVADAWGIAAVRWVRLRDLSPAEACVRLDAVISQLGPRAENEPLATWFPAACRQVAASQLLVVFDDVPILFGSDELTARLVILQRALAGGTSRVISTSAFQLPGELTPAGAPTIDRLDVPAFDVDDLRELFRAGGAPEAFLSNQAALDTLEGLTGGHPAIVAGLTQYLQGHGWRFEAETLFALLGRDHTHELNERTHRLLQSTVPDPDSRDLLYRSILIGGTYGEREVQLIASATPPISRPTERLSALSGVWLQIEGKGRYATSPLIRQLGVGNVLPETRKAIHGALAIEIMRKRRIDITEGYSAYAHFLGAEDWEMAAIVLSLMLQAYIDLRSPPADTMVLALYPPEQASLGMRIFIVGMQILLSKRIHGRLDESLSRNLDALMARATEKEAWAVATAAVAAGPMQDDTNSARALRYHRRALTALNRPELQRLAKTLSMPVETILWMGVRAVKGPADLQGWFEMIAELTPEQRASALAVPIADEGCLTLADQIFLREYDKPEKERDWDKVLAALAEAEGRARDVGLNLLIACCRRTRIGILADCKGAIDQALLLASDSLAVLPAEPVLHFLIQDAMGRQFGYAKRSAEALQWLEAAIKQDTKRFPLIRARARVEAAKSALNLNQKERAVELTAGAAEIARAAKPSAVAPAHVAAMLCEHGIALVGVERREEAFTLFEQSARVLLTSHIQDKAWKDAVVLLSHVVLFYAEEARKRAAPVLAAGHVAPQQGLFLTHVTGRVDYYRKERLVSICEGVVALATAVGKHADAVAWHRLGYETATRYDEPRWATQIRGTNIELFLAPDSAIPVLRDCFSAARLMVATELSPAPDPKRSSGLNAADPSTLGEPPNQHWRKIELLARSLSTIPVLLFVANLATTDGERSRQLAVAIGREYEALAAQYKSDDLRRIAKAFSEGFGVQSSWRALIDGGKSEPEAQVRAILYIAACHQTDAVPARAIQAHATVLPALFDELTGRPQARGMLLVPYAIAYWVAALARAGFAFRSPAVLGQELAQAKAEAPSRELLCRVLRAIADALDVRLSEETSALLRGRMSS